MFTPSGSTLLHVAWISHPRDRMKGFMWRSKSSIAFTSCEKTEAGVTMNWRAGYFNWWFFGGKRTGYLYSKSGLKSFQIKESESFFKRAPHLHLWKWSPNMENHFQPPPSHSQCLQEICNGKTAAGATDGKLFAPPDTLLSRATFVQSPSPSSSSPWPLSIKLTSNRGPELIIQHSQNMLNRLLFGAYNIHGGMVDVCTLPSIKIPPNSFPVEGS